MTEREGEAVPSTRGDESTSARLRLEFIDPNGKGGSVAAAEPYRALCRGNAHPDGLVW